MGRLSKKGAGLSLQENLKVLHQRTLGSKISKEEVPLELDDEWVKEFVDYNDGGSCLKVATKIGEEVWVLIKDVAQEATHELVLAKKKVAKMKAAKKMTKPKKKRKKKEMHDLIGKRLFVVYPT
jgi:hypothetical protein